MNKIVLPITIDFDKIDNLENCAEFMNQFLFNVDMLNYRLNRLQQIDTSVKDNQAEYLMTFDATLVLIRAMFLESERYRGNYTFQHYFELIGKPEIAEEINHFLDSTNESWNNRTIRSVLKFIADKFVCHVDSISLSDLGDANYLMSALSNPYFEWNLENIINRLVEIINK